MKKDFIVTEYTLVSDRIREPHCLVLLGDLHNAEHGPHNERLIEACRTVRPDLILSIGDLVTGKKRMMGEAVHLVRALAGIAPVYAVNGNHESNLRNHRELYRYLTDAYREAGVVLLNNRTGTAELGADRFFLTGIELGHGYYRKFRKAFLPMRELKELAGDMSGDGYRILLAHNPDYMPQYFRLGADLTVCGHNHGGFMRLKGGQSLISAAGFLLPPYSCGLYREGEQAGIVTAGLGEHTLPFRVHNPMELVKIRLKPE